MYTFELDQHRGLLRIALFGFWSPETARAFVVDQQAAVASLGCAKGAHLVLTDLSDFKIQSQEVVNMCKVFIDGARNSSRRLALVRGDGLARIQSKRVLGRDNMRMFDSIREAEQWLFGPSDASVTGIERPIRDIGCQRDLTIWLDHQKRLCANSDVVIARVRV